MHSPIVQNLSTDKEAFFDWLAKLNKMNGIAAGNELYKLIIALKQDGTKIDHATLQQVVLKITPLGLYLADFLEKSYLKQTSTPVVQLNIHLLRQLASLHLQLAQNEDIEQKRIQFYNYAVQMQGVAHYLTVLSYERPSSSLWGEMGENYRATLELKIEDKNAENLPPALQKLNTIEKAIKRNLLFAVFDAYRLPRTDIQALFQFCTTQHAYLELNKLGETSNEGYCWPYTNKQKPYAIKTVTDCKKGLVFNVDQLVNALRQGLITWPTPNSTSLLNALTNYKTVISSPLTALPNNYIFISEFERVIAFFNDHIRSGIVWTMNSPTPEHLNFSSLELVQEERRKTELVSHEDIWGKPKDKALKLAPSDFGAVKAIKTKVAGYFACEAIKAELRDQDLLALYGKDLKPYLAIVRRLETSKASNIQKALIEILPGIIKTVIIWDEKAPGAALIRKSEETTQLFLTPQKLMTGSILQTSIGQATLERLIEITPHFMSYAINFADTKSKDGTCAEPTTTQP